MKKAFTSEEMQAWRAAQPQKMVAVKVVVTSDQGNILTVQPSYKQTWQLPGGGVDAGESPEEATIRELAEETGIVAAIDDLRLKGTVYDKEQAEHTSISELFGMMGEDG